MLGVGEGVLTSSVCLYSREEEWGSGGGGSTPSGGNGDNKDYDGPAGMDVDGVIESTWTEVSVPALSHFTSTSRFSKYYLEVLLMII